MTTIREHIISSAVLALAGTTGVDTRIFRSRSAFVARAETPAIIIEPVEDSAVSATSLPSIDWSLTLRIVVLVRDNDADRAADPIIESLHSRLMSDLTLGGYAMDISPLDVKFEFMDSDKPTTIASCDYLIRYRTSNANLATSNA